MEFKRHILVRHGRRVVTVDLPVGVLTADHIPHRVRYDARQRLIRQESVTGNAQIRGRKDRREGNRCARRLVEENAAVTVHILCKEQVVNAGIRLPLYIIGLHTVCDDEHVLSGHIGGDCRTRAVLIFRDFINHIAVATREYCRHLRSGHTVYGTRHRKAAVAVDDNASHVVTVAVIHLHRIIRHHKIRDFSVGRRNKRSARGYRELNAVEHIAYAARNKALHGSRNSVHRDFSAYHIILAGRRKRRCACNRNSRHICHAAIHLMCHSLETKRASVLLLDDADGGIVLDKAVYRVRAVQRDINRSARGRQGLGCKADDGTAVQRMRAAHRDGFVVRKVEIFRLGRCHGIPVAAELHRTADREVPGCAEVNRTARCGGRYRRVPISAVVSHRERVMASLFSVCGKLDRTALNAKRTRRGIFKHHTRAERKSTGAVLQHEVAAAVCKVQILDCDRNRALIVHEQRSAVARCGRNGLGLGSEAHRSRILPYIRAREGQTSHGSHLTRINGECSAKGLIILKVDNGILVFRELQCFVKRIHRMVKGPAVSIDTAARDVNGCLDIAVSNALMNGLARTKIQLPGKGRREIRILS